MAKLAVPVDHRRMTKLLTEMTRADWLTRRWVNTTPPGSAEMMFTDAGDFPEEQRRALLEVLHAHREPNGASRPLEDRASSALSALRAAPRPSQLRPAR